MTEGHGPRERALAAALALQDTAGAEPAVEFDSGGRLLILGSGQEAGDAAKTLCSSLDCHLLTDADLDLPAGLSVHRLRGRRPALSGHLGRFEVRLEGDGEPHDLGAALDPERPFFDLVLDLGEKPAFDAEWGPPGAHRPGDASELEALLLRLPSMTGRVEKPKFFRFDSAICAHGQPGTEGCRRCIDACPAEAISSLASRIVVDAHLCQGGGACGTACPTGAISYAHPSRQDSLDALRQLLTSFREAAGDERPILVLLDEHAGVDGLADWPERVLPWSLQETASAGVEVWLAALAFGAAAVRVIVAPDLADRSARTLAAQLEVASRLLAALGLPEGAVSPMGPGDDPLEGEELPSLPPVTGSFPDSKPAVLRGALEHLEAQAPSAPGRHPLPEGAPLGLVEVSSQACTTCLSCAHACPTGALSGRSGDLAQLLFTESDCVQCGLCFSTCPEQAIELRPQLSLPLSEARRPRVLHEDEPFACVRCGTVFAPASTIRAVTERLADHPMFAGEAIEILKCCDDCRLRQL